jgi:surface protein
MKLSFKFILLYLVKQGIIKVKFLLLVPKLASSFAAPSNDKELSHSSRRDLQVTCPGGRVLNACANCCGFQFITRGALDIAVDAYLANKTTAINTYGVINCWDVSSITSMSQLFFAKSLNEPIGCWNVGSVTDMNSMFYQATNFNQPIGNWNVGSVTNMNSMFYGATEFNQPIGNWNVGSVTGMGGMFLYATKFNQPIGNWNVGKVTGIYYMFYRATQFNQNLCAWYTKITSAPLVHVMFTFSACPITANPDLTSKASFCRTCPTNNGGVQGGTLCCLVDPLIIKNHT